MAAHPTATASDQPTESIQGLRSSFFNGSRSDLNFKFLRDLSDAEFGDFQVELFDATADLIDGGDPEPFGLEDMSQAEFGHIPALMGLSRSVITSHPMGRPLGMPGDAATQRRSDATSGRRARSQPAAPRHPDHRRPLKGSGLVCGPPSLRITWTGDQT